MKKFTKVAIKLSLLVGVAMLGIYFGGAMVSAQFGGDAGGVGEIGGLGADQGLQGDTLMDVVKAFINRVLGLLSLIALVVLLYGGFNMVTAAGDDAKYKKGFKILQQAAVGLVIIGLSWIIVSAIFWLVGVGGDNSPSGISNSTTVNKN